MKNNGNNIITGDYYLGLDIGTDSIGWAVTDTTENYNILKFRGNLMQGIRLFDAASDCKDRRSKRTDRRRKNRTKHRLALLEMLFTDEISRTDPLFFIRLKNSFLFPEDKDSKVSDCKYTLFNDQNFNDINYMKQYPTVYHLRNELVHSKEKHDARLVFLAIHHILKKRGHFLFDGTGDDNITVSAALDEFISFVESRYETSVVIPKEAEAVLCDFKSGITVKKKLLCGMITADTEENLDIRSLAEILSGGSTDISKLLKNETYFGTKVKLSDDLDEKYDELLEVLDDDTELIVQLKKLFDTLKLTSILGENEYICESKVNLFKKNKADLKKLKEFVCSEYPEKYKEIFVKKSAKLNNYSAYSGKDVKYKCSQGDFCAYLKKVLPAMKDNSDYSDMWQDITDGIFLMKLSSKENGLIPNQVHRRELKKILENASCYLDFLNCEDEYGTVADKILSIFDYKIPYYIGPLNTKSDKSWVVRSEEKIYPWNMNSVVNVDESALKFMENLIGRCEYTGDPVLPKDSLIYSEYMLLNELNPLKINGENISSDVKNRIVLDLFVNSTSKVTKKSIKKYLVNNGLAQEEDAVSGVDDVIKSKLKSYHDFSDILKKYKDTQMVEEIIKGILVYGEDKRLLRSWLKRNFSKLAADEVKYICRLKYRDWGRLSVHFLTGIRCPDENGEMLSVIEMLRKSNNNLMQLLSDNYDYSAKAEEYKNENYGGCYSLKEQLDMMYISPGTRRAVLQTLRITDEIVDIMKSAPEKIFIEVAREHQPDKGRTETRKNILLKMYEECGEKNSDLYERLLHTEDSKLRDNTLYLYFMQLGKCMYSGEPIDIDKLTDQSFYDIDHIYPRSRILDDSLDNKVLVKSILNREKGNIYPIKSEIRKQMTPFWAVLKKKKLISEKKYSRLVRHEQLDERELSAFVNRQLVETQQSTKAVASLFKNIYGDAGTKIVYSKAGNVSRFRQQFDIVKCRELNDLHHAKDAYLNIVVGNVYDTKFTEQFFKNILNENYSLNRVFDYNVKGAWKTESDSNSISSIASVKKNLAKNSVRFTRMVKEVKGQISKETILSAGSGQLPVKKNLDIQKYGGYDKITGSYFTLVEHTVKNKRIRSLEPVYVYLKDKFEKDAESYCINTLGLSEPEVIVNKIYIESVIEINGFRYNITGRSNDDIMLKHMYQLVLDNHWTRYIKEIYQYIEKCRELNTSLDPRLFKCSEKSIEINKENNTELYKVLSIKLSNNIYSNVLRIIHNTVNSDSSFSSLEIIDQCKVIIELLKAFSCDSQKSDLTLIGGASKSGTLKFNKKLTNFESVTLVHQSTTGLFEYKVDLLK